MSPSEVVNHTHLSVGNPCPSNFVQKLLWLPFLLGSWVGFPLWSHVSCHTGLSLSAFPRPLEIQEPGPWQARHSCGSIGDLPLGGRQLGPP